MSIPPDRAAADRVAAIRAWVASAMAEDSRIFRSEGQAYVEDAAALEAQRPDVGILLSNLEIRRAHVARNAAIHRALDLATEAASVEAYVHRALTARGVPGEVLSS
jgi:hypothetical protein